MLTIAYLDARTTTIPNWLTLPTLALAGGWRLAGVVGSALMGMSTQADLLPGGWVASLLSSGEAVPAFVFMILAWGICFALWELHVLGGGDSKTLMGMFALFPTADFGLFLAVGVLVLSLPLLLLRLRGKRLRDAWPVLRRRLQSDSFFPTERELQEEGRSYAWTFCLPGVVYLWLLW